MLCHRDVKIQYFLSLTLISISSPKLFIQKSNGKTKFYNAIDSHHHTIADMSLPM